MGGGDLVRDGEGRLRVGWGLLAFVGIFVALTVFGFWALPLPGAEGTVTLRTLAIQSSVPLAAAVVSGWILLGAVHDRGPGALGFYLDAEGAGEAVRGLLLGGGVALAAVAAIAAAGGASWSGDDGTVAELALRGAATLGLLAIPAAAEEALFRGYPLQALARAWGPGPALVVTSVAFGLLHFGNPGLGAVALVNLTAAGAFLGVIYLRTGSLWWATGAHLGWNWAHGFVADLPVSGLELVDTPLWDGTARGAGWLGGGGFGPEGSVLTTAVVALATGFLWWGRRLRPGRAARAARPLTPLPPETDEAKGGG